MPLTPSSTTSGTPPTRPPTTTRPRQNASSTIRGVPSARDGSSRSHASSSARAISSPGTARVQDTRSGKSATRLSAMSRRWPSPISRSVAPGTRSATSRQAAARWSTFLYGSSTPTKSACGSAGQLGGRRLDERLDVGEGDERGCRLHADLACQSRRVLGQRPHGVRATQCPRGDAVGDGSERAAQRRAVQPRERAPVAVELDDERGPGAREAAPGQHGKRLVGALRRHRVRLEAPQLACDAKGQRRVERRAVEHGQPPPEAERVVASRAVRRRRDDADVESAAQCRELSLETVRQRQPVARSPDHEELPHRAASRSTASMRASVSSRPYSATDGAAAAASRSRRPRSP